MISCRTVHLYFTPHLLFIFQYTPPDSKHRMKSHKIFITHSVVFWMSLCIGMTWTCLSHHTLHTPLNHGTKLAGCILYTVLIFIFMVSCEYLVYTCITCCSLTHIALTATIPIVKCSYMYIHVYSAANFIYLARAYTCTCIHTCIIIHEPLGGITIAHNICAVALS